jgi:hypothetical protein
MRPPHCFGRSAHQSPPRPSRRRPCRFGVPRLEQLEDRVTPTGSITLTNAFVVNSANQAMTPDLGEEVFIQADFTTQGLPSNASYRVSYSVDGVTLETGTLTWGAGASGTGFWNAYWGGWFASPGTHNVHVTIDPTTYGTTSWDFSFTPVSAPDLPQKFITPLAGTPFQNWGITNYVDVNPLSGSFADYTGGPYTYDGHTGHDITNYNFGLMDAGVPIYAAAAGTVVAVQDGNYDRNTASNSLPANYVEIDHGNGWHTLYYHLRTDTILVHVGDAVATGQVLGLMGSSGNSTASHLHFQVEHNGDVVEPDYDPNTFWLNPLPYQGAVSAVIGSGVTSAPNPATTDLNAEEQPVDANVFSQASGQQITVWLRTYTRNGDAIAITFSRPDGTDYTALDYSFTSALSVGGYYHIDYNLPANLDLGTWHVGIAVNGSELARDSFQVTAGGAAAAHVSQGSTYVPNGRTTPIDFGTVGQGSTPPQLTCTVASLGSATLTLGNLVLPGGFALVGSLPASIAVGGSATFTLQLATGTPGTVAGIVQFNTNDPSAPTYRFDIKGAVSGGNPGEIHGQFFDDRNGDGIENGTDAGLVGWTVALLNASNSVLATTTTGFNGYYSFLNLAAGTYRVRETPPSGWAQSTANPADVTVGTSDVLASPFGLTPAVASSLAFSVQPGSAVAGVAISPAVKVEVLDQFGNVLTGDNTDQVSVAVASGPGPFTAGSTTSATVSSGVASFSNLVLTTLGNGYTLTASSSGLTPATTTPFNVGSLTLSNTSVTEFRPTGTAVGAFSTTEAGSGHTFTYSLVSGTGATDNASFTIGGNQLLSADAFDFAAKSSYSIRVRSTDETGQSFERPFTITITDDPALTRTGHTLTVSGTAANDAFAFTPGAVRDSMTLDGVSLAVDVASVNTIVFVGNGGSDTASLTGTGSGVTATLSPNSGQLKGSGYTASVSGVSVLSIQGGPGAVAYFSDSPGNDTFIALPGNSYLSGTGFWEQALGFGAVVAGSSGGSDRATLYGQAGASFLGTPTNSQLSGPGLWEQASGFKVVIASAVGHEQAVLYGSTGNDTLVGAPSSLYLTAASYWEQASGFAVVFAVGNGGSDTATLYDSAGDDTFVATPGSSYLAGSSYWNQVYNFGVVFASDSGQGNDRAYLYGSGGNDTFVGMPSTSYLAGTGFWEQTYGFKVVLAVGQGGSDVAQLYDSAGNDTFVATPGNSTLSGAGFWNQVFGFAQVFAVARSGGSDVATFYDSAGNDSFVGQGAVAYLSGPGYLNWSTGFASVTALSSAGGTDTADLYTLDFLFAEIGPWINHRH